MNHSRPPGIWPILAFEVFVLNLGGLLFACRDLYAVSRLLSLAHTGLPSFQAPSAFSVQLIPTVFARQGCPEHLLYMQALGWKLGEQWAGPGRDQRKRGRKERRTGGFSR